MSTDARNSLIAWGVVLGLLGLGWLNGRLGFFAGLSFWANAVVMIVLPLLIIRGLVQAHRSKSREAA
jgi:hypothetical protein